VYLQTQVYLVSIYISIVAYECHKLLDTHRIMRTHSTGEQR